MLFSLLQSSLTILGGNILRPLLTSLRSSSAGYPTAYLLFSAGYFAHGLEKTYRPPGLSSITLNLTRRIYTSYIRMTFGLIDSWVNYPVRYALYPIPFRRFKSLP